jgi:6-phosphogluconate dehydrogenase
MKIRQDSEGRVLIHLDSGEIPDLDEQVNSLLDFVKKQAIVIHRLTISYRKVIQRLDELESKVEQSLRKD